MTAPALTVLATSGCPPFCAEPHDDDFHSSTPHVVRGSDGRHFVRARVDQTSTDKPVVWLGGGNIELSETGARELAARLESLADQIAQARR